MIRRFAPAKLNLWLSVGARQPDGFHQLETVMVPISLGDIIEVRPTDHGVSLEVRQRYDFTDNADSVSLIPTDDQNLIVRIAKAFLAHCKISSGVHFALYKSIPAGGGLGGASANAAITLLLLNELFDLRKTWQELATFSANFGSDIAFFTQTAAARCRGRGEVVDPIRYPNPNWFVVVRPPFGLSTPAVFAKLAQDRSSNNAIDRVSAESIGEDELRVPGNNGLEPQVSVRNSLEAPAVKLRPELGDVKKKVRACYPLTESMSGSGSCWFGVFRHRRQATWAANRLRAGNVGRVDVVRPVAYTILEGGRA
ncbi:MAG: 4-(cytidine 5'-diphospho)-2-C-methyl-D-erythritol kinase [Planctomycetaceae bacterium]|nr:4-(cytidine 5'-diphospho)-2-C-methyl-D-erythritol kinase [Planctomycetaceae bacterium]